MRIIEEYIKKRKASVNQNNEKEYLKVLDLTTTGKQELELYTKFLIEKALEQYKK